MSRAKTEGLQITAKAVPGGLPETYPVAGTLEEVRAYATDRYGHRADLRNQDVRIELHGSGRCIEYAGPNR